VKFVYQRHRVKVKVAGTKTCLRFLFAGGLPSTCFVTRSSDSTSDCLL